MVVYPIGNLVQPEEKSGITYIVFTSSAIADAILYEIAVTPLFEGDGEPVWLWRDPENPSILDKAYARCQDGRVCVVHRFNPVTLTWLTAYLEGMTGVQILDALPEDWVPVVLHS
jgi:hypothetical protein